MSWNTSVSVAVSMAENAQQAIQSTLSELSALDGITTSIAATAKTSDDATISDTLYSSEVTVESNSVEVTATGIFNVDNLDTTNLDATQRCSTV